MTKIEKSWLERKAEALINRAKRSQFAREIFADARQFHADGYVMDVALMLSLRYWVGNPVTGEVSGVEVSEKD